MDCLTDKYHLRRQRLSTMRFSIVEGSFAMVAIGLNIAFYLPYLDELGASIFQLGLVVFLSSFLTAAIQFAGPFLLARISSLKKLALISTTAHALCYLPLAFLHYIMPGKIAVWPAIVMISAASVSLGILAAPWSDWMSHIVPRKIRGRYFSIRSRSVFAAQLGATIIMGKLFDMSQDGKMAVFTVMWIVCFSARLTCVFLFLFHYEPVHANTGLKNPVSPIRFFREHLRGSLGRFALSVSIMAFAVNLSSPFYAVHMLNDLKFSYTQYSVIVMLPSVVYITAIGIWGRISDHTGHVLTMKSACLLMSLAPFIWVFAGSFWLLLVNQVLFGIASSGYYLSVFNHSIGSLKDEDRTSGLSYMNGLVMFSTAAAALIGGLIMPHIPAIFGSHIRTIFALSVFAGMCSVLSALTIEKQSESQKLDKAAMQRILIGPYQRMGLFRALFSMVRRPF